MCVIFGQIYHKLAIVRFKANLSQENRVLCHVLRQFSIVLLWNTVHLKQNILRSIRLNFSSDNPALKKGHFHPSSNFFLTNNSSLKKMFSVPLEEYQNEEKKIRKLLISNSMCRGTG